ECDLGPRNGYGKLVANPVGRRMSIPQMDKHVASQAGLGVDGGIAKEEKMLARRIAKRLAAAAPAAGFSLALLFSAAPASADAGFQRWVAQFRVVAAQNGISGSTYDRAFRGVKAADPEVLEK